MHNMKAPVFLIIFLCCIGAYSFIRLQIPSPENFLVGAWNERTWNYERRPSLNKEDSKVTLPTHVQLNKGLLLHEHEKWEFLEDGTLQIVDEMENVHPYKWYLKGKGDVLLIKDQENQVLEHYKITHLDKDSMVLNFELDIQVKGLARLTFKRF